MRVDRDHPDWDAADPFVSQSTCSMIREAVLDELALLVRVRWPDKLTS